MTNERPDPLAPPEGYGARPSDEPDLSVCSAVVGKNNQLCDHPVDEIWWFGCTQGEHAGPMPYCWCHAHSSHTHAAAICGQCKDHGSPYVPVRWLKRTTAAGEPLELPGGVGAPEDASEAQGALDWAFRQGRRFA